jgi:hypothetical protein
MPVEEIYNLFVFMERNTITSLGVTAHELGGTDDQKVAFLQSCVDRDHAYAKLYAPMASTTTDEYEARLRLGRHLEIFEEIFKERNAPRQPLCVVTAIEDGIPKISASLEHGPTTFSKLKGTPLEKSGPMIDYLEEYVKDGGFDIPRLINDDFFRAIKMLYNERLYVSAAKLLMSCIDSIAFIEFGDVAGNFIKWLEAYAQLDPLGITPNELWEFRNGILHMTNLNSRAITRGKTKSLIISIGDLDRAPALENQSWKRLDLKRLLMAIAEAISSWVESYNKDREKFLEFVARYDLTVSDTRLLVITPDESLAGHEPEEESRAQ